MDRLAILARRTAPALAALVMGAAASSAALGQVAIHVSPGGSDSADGSAAAPVQSLTRAQTLVRAANANDDVVVHVDGGTYVLDEPLRTRTQQAVA